MKRIIMTISLVIVFASLFVFGVIFTGGQGSRGSIVPSVQAMDKDKDDDDDENGGSCPRNCSLRSLKGCYGVTFSGNILGFGPIAGIGVSNYDGQGHFTQTDTVNIAGSGGIPQTGTGTYTVNSDCTGSSVTTLDPGGLVINTSFVIVNHGKEFLFLDTRPGVVVTGSSKKQ